MVTHLNSCMIVLLLHSWISRAVGVGIDLCPWDDLCETLTQQQGHKSNRSHSLHRIISSWGSRNVTTPEGKATQKCKTNLIFRRYTSSGPVLWAASIGNSMEISSSSAEQKLASTNCKLGAKQLKGRCCHARRYGVFLNKIAKAFAPNGVSCR